MSQTESKQATIDRMRANTKAARRRAVEAKRMKVGKPKVADVVKRKRGGARGPQLNLPTDERHPRLVETSARVRYVEPPTRKDGNPFVACRVPVELRDAFVKWCKARKLTTAEALRAYMAKVTGVDVEEGGGE